MIPLFIILLLVSIIVWAISGIAKNILMQRELAFGLDSAANEKAVNAVAAYVKAAEHADALERAVSAAQSLVENIESLDAAANGFSEHILLRNLLEKAISAHIKCAEAAQTASDAVATAQAPRMSSGYAEAVLKAASAAKNLQAVILMLDDFISDARDRFQKNFDEKTPRTCLGINCDPVENDPEVRLLVDLARMEAEGASRNHPLNGRVGFCHVVWATQKKILKEKYNVEWKTPQEMNPDILFD